LLFVKVVLSIIR